MTAPENLDVSRETIERFKTYAALLRKWNPSINLVSKTSLEDVWNRHIIDSKQLFSIPEHPITNWLDLGSGGGFPGLVIAILAMESGSPSDVVLVESDKRKAIFLRTVIRETGVKAQVLNERVEKLPSLSASVISARALADLSTLLTYVDRHLSPSGVALFPKGQSWQKEMETAQSKWQFSYQVANSITETGPVILRITGVSRV